MKGINGKKVKPIAGITMIFLVTRLVLVLIAIASMAYVPMITGKEYKRLDASPVLDMWFRWDAGFYTTIAQQGHEWLAYARPSADMVFLPLYPLAIRAANRLSGCTEYYCSTLNGLIISNIALLASVHVLFDLTKHYVGKSTAWRSVLLLMLSPISIFRSGVYTESLFLLLSLCVFYALHRKRFHLAVLAASLACVTRTVGIALTFPLLLYARSEAGRSRVRELVFAHIPIVVFGAYVLSAGLATGDPLAYLKANSAFWNRSVAGAPWMVFLRYFADEDVSFWGWKLSWIDLLFTVFCLSLAVITLRRYPSFGAFALGTVAIPVAGGTLVAMPRYGAVAFPFYVVIAQWADRKWRQILVYSISICCLTLFTARFVTWHWIA